MPGSSGQDLLTAVREARLLRVLIVYLGASFAVLEAISLLTDQVGLPGWVVPGAIVLLLLGLPIIIGTALVQGRPAAPAGSGPSTSGSAETRGASRAAPGTAGAAGSGAEARASSTPIDEVTAVARGWLTWRRAILGGVAAFALLGIATAGYMTMRVLGIGPVGSLVAAGVLEERERILLADFENLTGDSLVSVVVTEALRIDLAQSPVVTVAEPEYVSQVLGRMGRDPEQGVDLALAREVAIREGLRAVIAGDVGAVGNSYVLTARIVAAESGEVLAGFRETAKDSDAIIDAIDRLSKQMRERIGESFRSLRRNPPLEAVTTGSLEALQKFSQAKRAIYTAGEVDRGISLLEEAIALDTTFAYAYSELATALSNRSEERARAVEAMTKAFEYRDRLTDRERYVVMGNYHLEVTREHDKAIAAYQSALEADPTDEEALNNLAVIYFRLRDFARAEELLRRALAVDSTVAVIWGNVIINQVAQGRWAEAEEVLAGMRAAVPNHPGTALNAAALASSRGDYAVAEAEIEGLREARRGNLAIQALTSGRLAALDRVQGRLADAEAHLESRLAAQEERGLISEYLSDVIALAWDDVRYRDRPERALQRIEASLARHPLDAIAPLDRPYLSLAQIYAFAGRPDRARALLAERESVLSEDERRGGDDFAHHVRGMIALSDRRPRDAIREIRAYDESIACTICALPGLGMAYDSAGVADSVIAIQERYLETPWLWRAWLDSYNRAFAHERLAELYERRGDVEKAIYHHGKLVDLWENADPELQPRVDAARRAIRSLSGDR